MTVSDLTAKQIKTAMVDMQKVRRTIGEYGEGVVVRYRGTNAAAGVPDHYAAQASGGHGKNASMEIFGHYFSLKDQTKAYALTHEMGHNTLNLSDRVPDKVVVDYGLRGSPAGGGKQHVYGWKSVDAAVAEGIRINDAFVCSVGFDAC